MLHHTEMTRYHCELCKKLLKSTSSALERHIRAVARLEDAVLGGRETRNGELKAAVLNARIEGTEALEKYHEHLATHASEALSRGTLRV